MKLADKIFRRDDWRMTSKFGPRKDPFTGRQAQHNGTDYGTGGGKWPLHAIENGVVVSTGSDGSRGKYVEVNYPRIGKRLLMYHLDSVAVKNGQAVSEGTVLGTTGTTGRSTGIHLHLGLRPSEGGAYEDPHAYAYKPTPSKPATNAKATMTMAQKSFIDRIGKAAQAGGSDILPSLTIAQAILESGWGKSGLTQKANALFGIKAGSAWKGPRVNSKTFEYYDGKRADIVDAFRAYGSWEESIEDHRKLLRGAERYKAVIGERDYKKACRAVHAAGYATAPDYADKLIKIIEQYGLTSWDSAPLSAPKEITHVIKQGDTLWSLAVRYLGSGHRWTEIQNLNDGPEKCDPHKLRIGATLAIPAK